MFDGREWQSCEQAFQGFKSVELKFQEKIRGILKSGSMTRRMGWSAGVLGSGSRQLYARTGM
jgi:hypothetical protein